jgi:hypothetical protein
MNKAYKQSVWGQEAKKRYYESQGYKLVAKNYRERTGHAVRFRSSIARIYGLVASDYDALFDSQGGVCAVCQRAPTHRRLCVDHNHDTGEIRGLICIACNLLVHQLERNDDPAKRARAYLANPPARAVLVRADDAPLTLVRGGK